jgi:putative ABC transport system permease protein
MVFRASTETSFAGAHHITTTPNKLLAVIQQDCPEAAGVVRIYPISQYGPFIVQYRDNIFQEERFSYADASFFQVFQFQLLKGNPDKALGEPNTVVMTETTATKYFGTEDPLGKIVKVNGDRDFTVTGVMQDLPSNSSVRFDLLGSFSSSRYGRDEPQWGPANFLTFVKVSDPTNISSIAEKVNARAKAETASMLSGENDYIKFSFIPITDIHLVEEGNLQYVYIFSAIAILILFVACINYVNLATARSADRAKEVGIRKVVGANKQQLFYQFIGESVLITVFAFILAMFISQAALPLFNAVTGMQFKSSTLLQPEILISAMLVLFVIAILSGAYPALAMTSIRPATILKGSFKFSGQGIWLRKFLVVTQFAISITLITCAMVIYKQLEFIQNIALGYDKENTLVMPFDDKTQSVYAGLRTELISSGKVSQISVASEGPTNIAGGYSLALENAPPGSDILINAITADENYLPTFEFDLKYGRNFTDADFQKVKADTTGNSSSFIVNESVLTELLIDPENALGTRLNLNGRHGEIIGVVKDFHFASLHKNIGPLVIFNEVEQFNFMFIKLNPGNIRESLAAIKPIFAKLTPHRPFEYQFVDQQFAALYASEDRLGSIFIVFAALAIIIACLGLIGLVAFSAAQKTKEIGIRKVLGATVSGIVVLITKDFTLLILIAIGIGLPSAYWIMQQWLSDFAYKTDIGVLPIVLASLLCLVIAFSTAGYQALKAALIDPVRTLRNE